MLIHKIALFVAAATGATSLSLAQVQTGEPLPSASVGSDAVGLRSAPGHVRGDGPDYRVTFARDGVEFVPALGGSASQTYPIRFAFESLRRGADVAPTRASDEASAFGTAVEYDRAPGIVERWLVRAEGVELTYHVAQRPAGAGDLVVSLSVDTELTLAGAGPRGARYHADGVGGVSIGAVTGIDAIGRRVGGTLSAAQDRIELTLPGEFVDTAVYPVVLDPLIGTDVLVSPAGQEHGIPDVAYEVVNQEYLFVWQLQFSANDVAIRGVLTDEDGVPISGLLAIRDISGVALEPTVAAVPASRRFFVAWQEGVSLFGPWDIYGACVSPGSGTVSAAVPIAATSASELRPDAGAERRGGQTPNAFVVWEDRSAGIAAAQVLCPVGSGPPVLQSTIAVASAGTNPAISKSGGLNGNFLIVYESPLNGIHAAVVDRSLVLRDADVVVTGPASSPSNPNVGGDTDDYLVVWDQLEPSASFGARDIYGRKMSYAGGNLTPGTGPVAIAVEPDCDERDPATAFLQFKYGVAWSEAQAQPASFAYDIRFLTIDPTTCLSCGFSWLVASTGIVFDGYVEMASARASGSQGGDEAMIALMSSSHVPPLTREVRMQRVEAIGTGGPWTNNGGQCGVPGVGGRNSSLAIGNTNLAFTLTGAEPAVNTTIFVLGAPGGTFTCGTCTILNPVISVPVPVSGGDATVPVPLGCDMSLFAGTFAVQWWPVGTSASPCAFLPTVSFSNVFDGQVGL